jgi:hypothetical protein
MIKPAPVGEPWVAQGFSEWGLGVGVKKKWEYFEVF